MDNPALRQRGQLVQVTTHAGAAHSVRGVVSEADTTTGESSQAYADAGPRAWIALPFLLDPNDVEFIEYADPSGTRLHRRVIRGERLGSLWNTCKLYLVSEATVMPARRGMFSPLDFSPLDFLTG